MNKLVNCECVTFPRSGHHLFQRLMQLNCPELVYCEQYNHCKSIPCTDPKTNFQKSHDFNLSDPYIDGSRYIIQFRKPYESIVSWYDLSVKSKGVSEDSVEQWKTFLDAKVDFWVAFMDKWVGAYPEKHGEDNFLNIEYSDLVENTEAVIRRGLGFLGYENKSRAIRTSDEAVAFNEFGRIIDSVPRRMRQRENFRYFDPDDVEFVHEKCERFLFFWPGE